MKARRLKALLGIFDNVNLKLQAKFLLEKNNIGSKNNDSCFFTDMQIVFISSTSTRVGRGSGSGFPYLSRYKKKRKRLFRM